jgi:hypothetical protein
MENGNTEGAHWGPAEMIDTDRLKTFPARAIVMPFEGAAMSETIRVVEYFYVMAANKPGEGARALATLRDAGVNLLAFSGFPNGRRAQLDFVPDDSAKFKQAAKKAKWKVVGPKRGFLVAGDDRMGAVAELLDRLASKKINVTAVDAVSVGGKYGALLWVASKDVTRAAALIGATRASVPTPEPAIS